ncbi:serine integrase family protein [Lignipirellula cremea]|uniref:DUF2802 domain-containing protein n=1 Tax=Lignipirellula cremea TaxID=2528010 RepID=A0A518DRD7_9BACT|nr:hypothetical protein [Lignipirellula cremea]QDU94408.1 hypothetical protein Pla8534_21980 [Lignipirellula cremea]
MQMLQEHLSTGMLMLGMGIAAFVLLRRRFLTRRKHRGKRSKETAPQASLRPGEIASAPPEFLRLQVELHETARDLKAEIDTKMRALSALSILAEERTAALERAIAEADRRNLTGAGTMQNIPPGGTRVPPATALSPVCDHDLRAALRLLNQGQSTAAIAGELGYPLGDMELALSLCQRPSP